MAGEDESPKEISDLAHNFLSDLALLQNIETSSFPPPSLTTTNIMAEIHDQFDTILILDFGSQVDLWLYQH